MVVFANDQLSAERRIDFAVFFIVLDSENSDGCSYLLRICFSLRKHPFLLRSSPLGTFREVKSEGGCFRRLDLLYLRN